jgi:hypothetical protein
MSAMRDLSLHVLDLIENAVRAGAATVVVSVAEEPERDRLTLRVEDDGPGLPPAALAAAASPFYTTKPGARTGLGLSLLAATASQAEGTMRLARSVLGGLLVEASLRLRSIDRLPLGDLGASLGVFAASHPELELGCRLVRGARTLEVRVSSVRADLGGAGGGDIAVAQLLAERVRGGLAELGVTA